MVAMIDNPDGLMMLDIDVFPGDSVLCGLTLSITDLWRSVFPVFHNV